MKKEYTSEMAWDKIFNFLKTQKNIYIKAEIGWQEQAHNRESYQKNMGNGTVCLADLILGLKKIYGIQCLHFVQRNLIWNM